LLKKFGKLSGVQWTPITPDAANNWLRFQKTDGFSKFIPFSTEGKPSNGGKKIGCVFQIGSPGTQTNRDDWMYDFCVDSLTDKATRMIENYNAEIGRWMRAGCPANIDDFVNPDETKIKWSSRLKKCFKRKMEAHFTTDKIRDALYRPFTSKKMFFDAIMTHRRGKFAFFYPNEQASAVDGSPHSRFS
jgi:predicted helicase